MVSAGVVSAGPPDCAHAWPAHRDAIATPIPDVITELLLQVDRRLAEHDLTHAQWLPLYRIARGDCDTMAALARDQSLDPGAMTRARVVMYWETVGASLMVRDGVPQGTRACQSPAPRL